MRHPLLLFAASVAGSIAPGGGGGEPHDEYDYIVVGSGPGGGPLASNLARAGFETLLVEAGDDASADRATNVAAYFASTGIPDNLHWDFYVRHYDDINRTLKFDHLTWRLPNGDLWVGPGGKEPKGAQLLGVNYPRGATLGGSSIINAGAVFLPSDSDWDYVKNITGDKSWSSAQMRRIFTKLEKNNYVADGTSGHGFDGYLEVSIGDGSQYLSTPQSVDVLGAMLEELGKNPRDLQTIITGDANYLDPKRDWTEGLWALPFHVNKTWGRYSARSRVLDTLKEKKAPLHVSLNSLASRILFDDVSKSGRPRAIGIEFLEGKSLYRGDPRSTSGAARKGKVRRALARKEVIVSGGAFNSPQLLKLSGIGPAAELRHFNISVVVDLPGVGTNMQDNQECAVVGLAAQPFVPTFTGPPAPACAPFDPLDPCYPLWQQGKGPYANAGPNSDIMLLKTSHSPDGERDMTVFSGPFVFRGFWPSTPNQTWPEPSTSWGMHTVKMHPQNRAGYVRLRSADPTDMPEINFNLFSKGAETDLGAIKDAIAWGRRALMRVKGGAGPMNITNPPCPGIVKPDGSCSDLAADEEFVRNNAFGHHVTSTCPIGADDDKMAVLDSNFRVRGVQGLRVVDASVFPRIPGSFPVVATYIISEKASEVIIGAAGAGENHNDDGHGHSCG